MEHDLRALYELLWKEVENFELKELFRARSEAIGQQMEHLEVAMGKLDGPWGCPARPPRRRPWRPDRRSWP